MGVSYGRTAASSVRRYVALSIECDGRPCDRDRATSVPRRRGVLMTIYCLAAGCLRSMFAPLLTAHTVSADRGH